MSGIQKDERIEIGNVQGDVTISQNQSGGVVTHDAHVSPKGTATSKRTRKWIVGNC